MNDLKEDFEMVLTMQDEELREWNEAYITELYENNREDEDEAFTRWKLFTFFLLDTDTDARLI